jgi:predicted phosphatase
MKTAELSTTLIEHWLQEQHIVSLAQAARETGVSLQTLSSAVSSGRVPALKMPDKRRYVQVDVVRRHFERDAWLEKALAAGLIRSIPRNTRIEPYPNKAKVEGKTLSQTIIDDRNKL